MLLVILHRTELAYSDRISETVMELRMTPRTDSHQTLRASRIDVGPAAPSYEHVDWLGNRVHQFSVMPFHERVAIVAQSGVEVHPAHPSPMSLSDELGSDHGIVGLSDFKSHGGLVPSDPRPSDLARRIGIDGERRLGVIVSNLSGRLRDHIEYRKGVTTSAATLAHALDEGAGVCQDLAHIAIGLLRGAGCAARYVSGYYHGQEEASEVETHAWCEVFFPSFGWIPIDPTHRSFGGVAHVAVAIGRDFSDVPPNRGVYRGTAEESISVRVAIEERSELPESLAAPRAFQVNVPTHDAGPLFHREQLDYQQEQQQQ
jgi:transglutaminase-like putative cysteine protease